MNKLLTTLLFVAVFWNVENLSDNRPYFSRKCDGIASTLLMISDQYGLPDLIGLAEVQNDTVLKRLIYGTSLRKLGYRYVHYDSPDRRGIDCALLYRPSSVKLKSSKSCHLSDSCGNVIPTRDILLAEFDSLAVLVNHHPSKVGKGSAEKRAIALSRMFALCDSLESCGCKKILCIGDFNDNLWGEFSQGTIKYNGEWNKIDGYFSRGLDVQETVFIAPHLTVPDKKFGGRKPFRSYSGPRYLGGVSDHLPVVFIFD